MYQVGNHVLTRMFLPVADVLDQIVLQLANQLGVHAHLLARLQLGDLGRDRMGPALYLVSIEVIEPELLADDPYGDWGCEVAHGIDAARCRDFLDHIDNDPTDAWLELLDP